MIDLETVGLGNKPGILSIGACMFNLNGDKIIQKFHVHINVQTCLELGLTQDAKTMKWWDRQDSRIRESVFSGEWHLRDALEQFSKWYVKDTPIWSYGSVADMVWLESAYKACGIQTPWDYWDIRCARTILQVFRTSWVKNPKQHDALSDAVTQAKTLQRAFKTISHNLG